MTDEQLENNIAALRAAHAGKPIQCRQLNAISPEWVDLLVKPSFRMDVWKYRPKPEPKLRPWTRDEVPLGKVIVSKLTRSRFLLLAVESSGRCIRTINGYDTPEEMLEYGEMEDGGPCGVIVP